MNEDTKTTTTTKNLCVVQRTTLGDYNRGVCGNANNSRYNGSSPCYVVWYTDDTGHRASVAFNRKWVAQAIARWVNTSDWDGCGDVVGAWESGWEYVESHSPYLVPACNHLASIARWLQDDTAKEV
jgi:hypothetical protein